MSESVLKQAIERGVRAHQARQFDEALESYSTALRIAPDDAEAMSLCGLALLYLGQHERAMPLLRRAVEREPDQSGFRLNFAEGLERTKQYDDARREIQTVLVAQPRNARAWDRAGDVAAKLGDEDGAAESWVRAYSLELTNMTPALKFSQLQMGRGRFDLALRVLDSASAQVPGHATVLALKSEVLIAIRNWPALQATASDWLQAHPASADAWRIAARAAFEQGRHVEAANAFSRVLSFTAPTASDLSTYASLNLHALNYEAAAAALDQAEAIEPEHPEMLATRALLHMYFGRFAEAESCCRRSLARDPENTPAYNTLSRLRRGHLSDGETDAVTRLAQRSAMHIDHRIAAAFAAAHAQDARGDIDAAMAGYESAHALAVERDRQEDRSYDPSRVEQRMRRIQELAAASLPASIDIPGTPRPVFIVGMPRSGTTLIEGVLAAHSRVVGCGERPTMQQILRALLALDASGHLPDAATLQSWSSAYFRDLSPLGHADHITDKHPLNFEAAGLIAHLLPRAVIVHVRRNPVETCLSIYRQEFNKHWTFAHRFADIAHYYEHYARLVSHWERTLSGRFVTIQFEELAGNFQIAAPDLLQACGLEWESQCLRFQETQRPIATFSTVQARDPVRLGSGRADRYQKHLASLAEALERASVDLKTGALVQHPVATAG